MNRWITTQQGSIRPNAAAKITLSLLLLGALIAGTSAIDDQIATMNAPSQTAQNPTAHENTLQALLQDESSSATDLIRSCIGIELSDEIDPDFCTEVLDPTLFEQAYCSDALVCIQANQPLDACAKRCAELLAEKGWTVLEGTNDHVASFTKADGAYRWILVQYFAIGEKTSVLVTTDA